MLKSLETSYAMLMLIYTTGAFLPFLRGHGGVTEANTYEIAVQIPLYCLAVLFSVLHWTVVWEATWQVKWIVALTAITVASAGWSPVPLFALRRGLILAGTTAFGIYFGARFDINEQLCILVRVCALVVGLSFVFIVFLPQYGLDSTFHNGSWRGIFAQKNSLGRIAVFSAIVFYFAQPRAGRWLAWTGIGASVALVLLSKSATSLVILALVASMQIVFRLLRTRSVLAVPAFSFGGVLLALIILSGNLGPPMILKFLNRDPSLTGRVRLWELTMWAIARRPWFGYGFKSFWLGMEGASAAIVQQLHWSPPSAHNGFLDILLEVGIVGLCLFAIGYLLLWRRALMFLRRDPSDVPLWLCTYLFFMLVYNFSERTILDQNTIFWALYAGSAVNLYLDLPRSARATAGDRNLVAPLPGQVSLEEVCH